MPGPVLCHRKVPESQEGLKLNASHQLLVCVDVLINKKKNTAKKYSESARELCP